LALANVFNVGSAPSCLIATVEDKYESDEDFRWAGDEDGLDFDAVSGSPDKSYSSVAPYPSCKYASVKLFERAAPSPPVSLPQALLLKCIFLTDFLHSTLACMLASSISPDSACSFTVVNTGATDHQ
jgi:hypothetical protein